MEVEGIRDKNGVMYYRVEEDRYREYISETDRGVMEWYEGLIRGKLLGEVGKGIKVCHGLIMLELLGCEGELSEEIERDICRGYGDIGWVLVSHVRQRVLGEVLSIEGIKWSELYKVDGSYVELFKKYLRGQRIIGWELIKLIENKLLGKEIREEEIYRLGEKDRVWWREHEGIMLRNYKEILKRGKRDIKEVMVGKLRGVKGLEVLRYDGLPEVILRGSSMSVIERGDKELGIVDGFLEECRGGHGGGVWHREIDDIIERELRGEVILRGEVEGLDRYRGEWYEGVMGKLRGRYKEYREWKLTK